ncbi:ABC transporter substrate-binding protein [Thermodesulfobacteriota bacterium]
MGAISFILSLIMGLGLISSCLAAEITIGVAWWRSKHSESGPAEIDQVEAVLNEVFQAQLKKVDDKGKEQESALYKELREKFGPTVEIPKIKFKFQIGPLEDKTKPQTTQTSEKPIKKSETGQLHPKSRELPPGEKRKAFMLKAAETFAEDEEVVAVIGHSNSRLDALPVRKTYETKGLVLITPTASNPAVTQDADWVFSGMYNDRWQGAAIAAYIMEILGDKARTRRVLLIYEENAYGENLKKGFEDQIERLSAGEADKPKLQIVEEMRLPDHVESKPEPGTSYLQPDQTTRLRDLEGGVDAVVIFMSSELMVDVIKSVRQSGVDKSVPIIGPDALSYSRVTEDLKKAEIPDLTGKKLFVINAKGAPPVRMKELNRRITESEATIVGTVEDVPQEKLVKSWFQERVEALWKEKKLPDAIIVLGAVRKSREDPDAIQLKDPKHRTEIIWWDEYSSFPPGEILVANHYFHELAPMKTHALKRRMIEAIVAKYRKPDGTKESAAKQLSDTQLDHAAIFAFDAARLITEGIMAAFKASPATAIMLHKGLAKPMALRPAIRRYLKGLDDVSKAVPGLSGDLYFRDGTQNMARPVNFSLITPNGFVPASTQLVEIPKSKVTEAIEASPLPPEARGWIGIEDQWYDRRKIVFCGIDIYRINQINLTDQNFDVEFFVWFRWISDDKILDAKIIDVKKVIENKQVRDDCMRFWDGIYGIEDKTDVIVLGDPNHPEKRFIGFKVKGTFKNEFQLQQYPFDEQTINIRVSLPDSPAHKVLLAVDRDDVSIRHVKDIYPREYFSTSAPVHSSGTWPLESSLGNPFGDSPKEKGFEFSAYNVSLQFRRKVEPYLKQLFLPLLILNGLALCSFLIPTDKFSARIAMVPTAILSTLVFHVSRADDLPNVGYMTLADKYFVVSYIFMGLATAGVLLVQRAYSSSERTGIVMNAVFFMLLFFGVSYLFLMLTKDAVENRLDLKDYGEYSVLAFQIFLWSLPLAVGYLIYKVWTHFQISADFVTDLLEWMKRSRSEGTDTNVPTKE